MFPAIEVRAGIQQAGWTLAARISRFGSLVVQDCITLHPVYSDGTHTDRLYPYERGHGGSAMSLRLQHASGSPPVTIGVGGGWLKSAAVPYALGSLMVRTEGPIIWSVEVESWVLRLAYDEVTARWSQHQVVEELRRTSHHSWRHSASLRFGVDWPLF